MARILISLVLFMLTAVCIYSAHVSGKGQNAQGAWLFYAFSLFFAIPLAVIVIKALGQKNSGFRKLYDKLAGPQQEQLKFVPHWVMMLVMLVSGIVVFVNIVRIVLRFTKSF